MTTFDRDSGGCPEHDDQIGWKDRVVVPTFASGEPVRYAPVGQAGNPSQPRRVHEADVRERPPIGYHQDPSTSVSPGATVLQEPVSRYRCVPYAKGESREALDGIPRCQPGGLEEASPPSFLNRPTDQSAPARPRRFAHVDPPYRHVLGEMVYESRNRCRFPRAVSTDNGHDRTPNVGALANWLPVRPSAISPQQPPPHSQRGVHTGSVATESV